MQETPILDLLYDVMDIFDNNEVAVYSAIKSIHRKTNIEHIINHIDSQISLEQYRQAFIQIMGFNEKKIDYYMHLSQFDFKDTFIVMEALAKYFKEKQIDHGGLRRHQEIVYLTGVINNAEKLISIINKSGYDLKQGNLL